ncbi:MAG: hypothetical protein A2506_00880 [Elusimicrobia bacterium RIFOXYD12_FULL_66_9]|nr:MAG: hypothetical protein A2506_00880 [Elusimicrobia bacterium RIFOXYD12_FULL_66_9]
MDRDNEARWDGRAVFLAALALRVAWAMWAGKFWGYRDDGAYDDGAFLDMARALLGQGHVSLTHAPGYSLALAPFLALGEAGVSLARWAQMLLSAYTAVLACRLASALRLGRPAALAAGLFVAFHPMLVFFSARMMSETLFVALAIGFLLAWLAAWRSGSLRDAALAGLLGGLASLTRPVMLPYGGVLALVALWRRREQLRWAVLVAACGLAWTASLVPWTVRNWSAHHRFAPVVVQGGWNFYEGLTVDPDEVRSKRAQAMGEESRALGLSDPFARDAYFSAKARAWIAENPGEFLRLCAVKAARFWRFAPEPPHSRFVRLGAGAFTLLLFAAALAGLPAVAAVSGAWFLFAWAAHLNLLHAVFASNLRYRLPIEPILAVLAGAGLAALLRRRRG